MTRVYGVPVAAGGRHPTEKLRTRLGRGRPNWWVILAVSLALIALLVETSGTRGSHGGTIHAQTAAETATRGHAAASSGRHPSAPAGRGDVSSTTTTTTKPAPTTVPTTTAPVVVAHTAGTAVTPPTVAATTTTTSAPATTTTTQAVLPADRSEDEGYLAPPGETAQVFDFSGSGTISVLWSGDVYLKMTVVCPNGSQTIGGTGGIQMPVDSTGTCQATVSEPAPESTAVTFNISGPAGG
jgi:hypothetical protein